MNKQISILNVVVNKALSSCLIQLLEELCIEQYFIESGRTSIFGAAKSFLGFSTGSKLLYEPVEIFRIYAEEAIEEELLNHIYHRLDLKTVGKGSVFSSVESIVGQNEEYRVFDELKEQGAPKAYFFDELKGIGCVVQRGEGDEVAKISLNAGASVPFTTYGLGSGVRDKLGLLRITIPPEKEIINLIMSKYDVDSVMELFISHAKLNEPGRGIAYIYPVKQGIVNTRISLEKAPQAASMEQVISAIDSIKGGMEWRKAGLDSEAAAAHSYLTGLVELGLISNEGYGSKLSAIAMEHGAGGATICKLNFVSKDKAGKPKSSLKDYSKMIVSDKMVDSIAQALKEAGAFEAGILGLMSVREVEKAFTYLVK